MKSAEDIFVITNTGKMFAASADRQYWALNGIVYSVRNAGDDYSIWCSEREMNQHLHRLMQITGKRFFTEDKDMKIVDPDYLAQFTYA